MYLGVNGEALAGKGFLRTMECEDSPSGHEVEGGGMVRFASNELPRLRPNEYGGTAGAPLGVLSRGRCIMGDSGDGKIGGNHDLRQKETCGA